MQGRCNWPASAHNRLAFHEMVRKMLIELSTRERKGNSMKTLNRMICGQNDNDYSALPRFCHHEPHENMKTFLTCIFLLAALNCPAPSSMFNLGSLPPDPWPAQNAAIIAARGNPPPHQWRLIDGVTYNIRGQGYDYYYSKTDSRLYASWGSRPVLAAGWFLFKGKVVEVQPLGIRVRGFCNYFGTNASEETIFVVNYPGRPAEGDTLDWHAAREEGLHTYTTVMGAGMTLHQFDYGLVVSGPPIPPPPTAEELRAAQAAAEIRQAEAKAKILKYDREMADKGDAYGERRMGERCRDGDGVPKNLQAAQVWLTLAAAQGDKEAATDLNLLSVK